jgi:hypothetical protein
MGRGHGDLLREERETMTDLATLLARQKQEAEESGGRLFGDLAAYIAIVQKVIPTDQRRCRVCGSPKHRSDNTKCPVARLEERMRDA